MFARMTHGIPEYNALTDKHCAGHNFLDLAPVKQLVKSGLVKKRGDGKLQVVERPSRYLFFGEQPDGPASTRPATGKRSERYRKFKQERSPKLQQVEAERVAAIRRCRLEPLNKSHGVNSALRVVLSSPDLNAKREDERQRRRERQASPGGYTPPRTAPAADRQHGRTRRRRGKSSHAKTAGGRRRRGGGSALGEGSAEVGFGFAGGDAGSMASWNAPLEGAAPSTVDFQSLDAPPPAQSGAAQPPATYLQPRVTQPLHAGSNERLQATNAEYAAVHRVPSADLNEFLKEKRRQEELELQAAAELNRRGAHGSGYYAQRHSEQQARRRSQAGVEDPQPAAASGAKGPETSTGGGGSVGSGASGRGGTIKQARAAAVSRLSACLEPTEERQAITAAHTEVEQGWHAMQATANDADAEITRHFERMRRALQERENTMRRQLSEWAMDQRKRHETCLQALAAGARGLDTAVTKCQGVLEAKTQLKPSEFVERANAALANMDAARERSQMALNPQANPLPPRAQLRLAFGVRAAAGASLGGGPGSPGAGASADADLAHVIAGHGNIIIVPDRDVDDGQRGVEAGEAS